MKRACHHPVGERISGAMVPFVHPRTVGRLWNRAVLGAALGPARALCARQAGRRSLDTLRHWGLLMPLALWGWLVTGVSYALKLGGGAVRGTLGPWEICPALRATRDEARNSLALFTIYNRFGAYGVPLDTRALAFAAPVFACHNARAVRHRLDLVVAGLVAAIEATSRSGEQVDLLSIASGSAQAVWMALRQVEARGLNRRVRVLLLDRDSGSLAHARRLAAMFGYEDRLISCAGSASEFAAVCLAHDFHPTVVEMAGFLDYRTEAQATRLLGDIARFLGPEGVLVTCHIHPNREIPFVRWALGWPMTYRSPAHFRALLAGAGLEVVELLTEPLGVHSVAVCQRGRLAASAVPAEPGAPAHRLHLHHEVASA